MAYDFERFREKREKVLGVRTRGLSFGAVAALVAGIIVLGLALVVVPKTVSYLTTKSLDDAIYRMSDSTEWNQEVVKEVGGLAGVRKAVVDKRGKRLVITFDREETGPEKFNVVFERSEVKVDLLNRVGHREHESILKKEAEFEAL